MNGLKELHNFKKQLHIYLHILTDIVRHVVAVYYIRCIDFCGCFFFQETVINSANREKFRVGIEWLSNSNEKKGVFFKEMVWSNSWMGYYHMDLTRSRAVEGIHSHSLGSNHTIIISLIYMYIPELWLFIIIYWCSGNIYNIYLTSKSYIVYLNVITLTLKCNCQNIQAYIFKLLKLTWKFLTNY